ncbi:hypothetical protein RUA4292_01982 [Ruegeria atlantica]|uniref:Uncharacterized protein n=1 Tax=Ruegeria atlantica TaxID=81569 RepID=A0A0N7LP79_9RHOB|nr:hypothetical protein RUM4293_03370 [Ruegeria atlantica]CUH47806.1 hypothetical protein RUA4292_01982 [Ruegeria atlantica]
MGFAMTAFYAAVQRLHAVSPDRKAGFAKYTNCVFLPSVAGAAFDKEGSLPSFSAVVADWWIEPLPAFPKLLDLCACMRPVSGQTRLLPTRLSLLQQYLAPAAGTYKRCSEFH